MQGRYRLLARLSGFTPFKQTPVIGEDFPCIPDTLLWRIAIEGREWKIPIESSAPGEKGKCHENAERIVQPGRVWMIGFGLWDYPEGGPRGWYHHSTIYDTERGLLWEREGQHPAEHYFLMPAPDHCQRKTKSDGELFILPREESWLEIFNRGLAYD